MVEIFQALEIIRGGKGTGRYHMTVRTTDPDTPPTVAQAAIGALGRIGDPGPWRSVARYLTNAGTALSITAGEALGRMKAGTAVPAVTDAIRRFRFRDTRPAYLIASTLEMVVAQRLARRLCSRCKESVKLSEADMTEADRAFLGASATTIAKAKGCSQCYNTGYSGRVGLFEVLPVTKEIRRLVLDHANVDAIQEHARTTGVKSLRDDGLRKVLAGVTTIEEVQRVTV